MLIQDLDNLSKDMKEISERIHKLNKEYRTVYDRAVMEDIRREKTALVKKKLEVIEAIYENLEELRLLKRHFPQLYSVLLEDPYIGKLLKRKGWLLDFQRLDEKAAKKRMDEVKAKRGQIRDANVFLKKWVGAIDSKSLTSTWPELSIVLAGIDKIDKDELQRMLSDHDRRLRREEWLVSLNKPFVLELVKARLKRLYGLSQKREDAERIMHSSAGLGTVTEYSTKQSYEKALAEEKRYERKCRHMVVVNQEFMDEFLSPKVVWREKPVRDFIANNKTFLKAKRINELEWLGRMRKEVSS
ncbi:MAG: hypothetical protein ACP5NX_03670 [Candidatus Bilamarchaeaceae archaeon]